MRIIFERIKQSSFYKKYLKQGGFINFLRRVKHFIERVLRKLKSMMPHKEHYEDFFTAMEQIMTLSESSGMEMSELSQESVDVIIPIYNGYEYLVRLFQDLPKAGMKCHFILVDDKSTDERVRQLEQRFVTENKNAELLENPENYGFVKSVNRGLEVSKGHVALVNTDTELPWGWLARLMYPIIHDEKTASATPYSNSATLFSFPRFGVNNRIYRGMTVEELDGFFKRVKPRYVKAPTGVGFCMGLSHRALNEIGNLDYDTFTKGFGEENDWCQRAIKKGYANVQVENLFVYHKHGGSFPSQEKERLLQENLEKLKRRYPTYDYQVGKFLRQDPNRDLRERLQMVIDTHQIRSVLFFDHSLGGGATSYLEQKKLEMMQEECCVSVIRYRIDTGMYHFIFENDDIRQEYTFSAFGDVLKIGEWLHFDEIYINELVTYPDLWETQQIICRLKDQQNSSLVMLFHDFFAVCPTINLLNTERHYCGMPNKEECETCYLQKGFDSQYRCESREEWVQRWKEFLLYCTEVRTFSKDTRTRVEDTFGSMERLTLVPHQVEYAFPIYKNVKTTDTLNIGLLGVMAIHKGSEFVTKLLDEIDRQGLGIQVKLIGYCEGVDLGKSPNFSQTGSYQSGELPRLIYEQDIDLFLVPAIWPETFSYTTQEIIQMGMPVAVFDLGAPAERVVDYEKGLLLENEDPKYVIAQIQDFISERPWERPDKAEPVQMKQVSKKLLYVVEYISFSSRYRVEHMMEELLYLGIPGYIYEKKSLPRQMDWDQVEAVVIYRCRYTEELKQFLAEAKSHHVTILYDVDDYIFDYDAIRELPFMQEKEYRDFEKYSSYIRQCMEVSDKLLVSTDHLKLAAEQTFPVKPVYVNRNAASAELLMISVKAQKYKKKASDKIVLGYFSGSHTHNRDFELISDILLEFLREHEETYLKIVGCLELPEAYDHLKERIIEIGFLPWRDLPREIATVDINLMPLEESFFHACKSENKWMEAALVRTPTIGSYNDEIAGATRPGENILLCRNEEEWRDGLRRLAADNTMRREMAEQAYRDVLASKTTLIKHTELLQFIIGE